MTIQQLDDKHSFNWRKVSRDANVGYLTAFHFAKGEFGNISTAAKIINALPISQVERAALIENLFAPRA